jgi:enamine deaminase RidA (YjgF/YER057c/UK114 family)
MPDYASRLRQLGLALPEAPKPVASYVPAVRTGNLVFVSGQIPIVDGALLATGTVPDSVSIEEAQGLARQCVLNGLAVFATETGSIDRLKRVVRVGCFVASSPGFGGQPQVANGASDLLCAIFGEAGQHARAAVGSVGLPLNVPVEIEFLFETR